MGQTERYEVVPKEVSDKLMADIRSGAKKITLASQDMVTKYDYQMQVVLGILDHNEALVTDESTVGDFVDSGEDAVDVARLAELSDIFNMPVSLNTKLWELAKAICFEEYGELSAEHNSQT